MQNQSENRIDSTSSLRVCQNCKKEFNIEAEDFLFYEKIKVPPPTFCPDCRFKRRLVWRNERVLYKRICDLCEKNIIAMYHESVPFPVYCHECWYGDGWDPMSYGRDYDFSRNFFEQYKELSNIVPRFALWQRNAVNSDYANMVGESKNVYLSVSVVKGSDNVFYSKSVDKSSDIIDCLNLKECNSLYECIEGDKNHNSQYLLLCRNCVDSYYLVDCVNCSNCFLSRNLRNKQYCIKNKQYSKEQYFEIINNYDLQSRKSRRNLLNEFSYIKNQAIYRFSNIVKSTDSTGNNLLNVKNVKNSFDVYDSENIKYSYRVLNLKDSMDVTYGGWSQLIYEYVTGALNDYNVKFSYSAMDSVHDADYTEMCRNSSNIFGCIGLNNKEYAIFNKIYTPESFEDLRRKIIEHMNKMPYVNRKGLVYKYGEFFPVELSPWAYNETMALEVFPLNKQQVLDSGFSWIDKEKKNFNITVNFENIIDDISKTDERILQEVLACADEGKCNHLCQEAFRVTSSEFQFYKKHNIPIPDKCPNCRHFERLKYTTPFYLWHRKCMKDGCQNEFETSYSPDRPEIIYCERCYQQ